MFGDDIERSLYARAQGVPVPLTESLFPDESIARRRKQNEGLSLSPRPPAPVQAPDVALGGNQEPYGLSLPPRAAEPPPAPMNAYSLRPRSEVVGPYNDPDLPGYTQQQLSLSPRSAPASALSLPPRPPMPVSIPTSADGSSEGLPEGLPRYEGNYSLPPRAPRPPLRTESAAYGRFQDERARLPTEEQYLDANKPRGIGGRIGSSLKLAGKLLVASGFNPLMAAAGGVIGAVDPNANARFSYRQDLAPRSFALQERYLRQAGTELGMQNVQADNERADKQLEMSTEAHADSRRQQQANLEDRTRGWTERLQEKTLNDWMLRNPGRPIPKSIAASGGHPELEGYVPPQKAGNGQQPHFQYNQATGETAIVETDGSGGWKISRPSGQRMEPTPEPLSREPLSNFEAEVGPDAYGVKSWSDLMPNPEYGPAYQEALEAAKSIAEPGQSPEEALNSLIAFGRIKLPQKQIPAYEYARKNPHPLKSSAAAARKDQRGISLGPRPPKSGAGGKVRVIKSSKIAEAARRKGMTEDAFRQWAAGHGVVIQ